jgi:hypothetical protein
MMAAALVWDYSKLLSIAVFLILAALLVWGWTWLDVKLQQKEVETERTVYRE